jgi:hypothetical protein
MTVDLEITQTQNGDAAFVRGLTAAGRGLQSTLTAAAAFGSAALVPVADAVALAFRAKAAGAVVRVNGQVQ